jgi:hypothetical protein
MRRRQALLMKHYRKEARRLRTRTKHALFPSFLSSFIFKFLSSQL